MPASAWLDVNATVSVPSRSLHFRLTAEQQVVHVSGPSGSGKTSFLRALLGFGLQASGRIRVDECVLLDSEARISRPSWDRGLAWCPQEATLIPHYDVRRNMLIGAGHSDRLQDVAELLSLKSLFERAPANLSGGERQRVALGRALLSESRVALLDEPFNAQPKDARTRIASEVVSYLASRKMRAILVTHDSDELAMFAADRWTLTDSGFNRCNTL